MAPQTFGMMLVNDLLPPDLRFKGPATKREIYDKLYAYARRDPDRAAHVFDRMRELGHDLATTEGTSITLDDITPPAAKYPVTRDALRRIRNVDDVNQRRKILATTQNKILDLTKGMSGSQGMLIRSGARGSPIQAMRSYVSPVAPREADGNPYPWLVHHSASEGLRPSEMIATNVETRNNQIATYLSITEPGDFSKVLVNNMGDQLILSEDCGTRNGVQMRTDDPHIVDRFLAQDSGSFRAGTLITPQMFSRLRKKGGTVLVRSPMTCEHNDGICQKCYGQDEKGQVHSLGTNVGIRSAQAITEPLTQFALGAKHGLRQAGEDKVRLDGMKGMRAMLEMPPSFTHRATLSSVRGTVDKVKQAPQGGHDVFVGQEKFYVPPHLKPAVKPGQHVSPGDSLSDGIPMPDELVRHKGMGTGRKYMVDQLHKVYQNQGVDVDKRHLEILARTHLNHVQVENDPENRFLPGEVVSYPALMRTLADDVENRDTKKAAGRVLGRPVLHHTAGTPVTPEIAKELASAGYKRIPVARRPPTVSFVMQPITRNPLLNPDWMARLGHRYLKESILEGVHQGQRTDIHGTHPVPAYVHGADFGKGPGGRY